MRAALASLLVATTLAAVAGTSAAHADALQGSLGMANSGWYPDEPALTPSAVGAAGQFGTVFDAQLEGKIYAEPLYDPTPSASNSDPVVLVVTEDDLAYGVDATTGAVDWQTPLGTAATPATGGGVPCGDIGPSIGVTGTPVIDPATNTAYIVNAETSGPGGSTQYFLQALDVATGQPPATWPAGGVPIQGPADNDANLVFDAEYQTQRTALVLVNGVVYAGFSSQCDYVPPTGSYSGWVVGVSTASASITSMWASETGTGQDGSGIWQAGGAPVVDASGNLYYATGNNFNGDVEPNPGPGTTPPPQYSDSLVQLSTAGGQLAPTDYFMPSDASALNIEDLDMSSAGPVELPSSMSTSREPHLLLEGGKGGTLYLLNMDNLGGYQDANPASGSTTGVDNVPDEVMVGGAIYGHPALWPGDGGYVYVPVSYGQAGDPTGPHASSVNVFQRVVSNTGAVGLRYVGEAGDGTFNFGMGSPIVTSDATTSGSALVWEIHSPNANGSGAVLEAFDALPQNPGTDGTLAPVWTSKTFDGEKFTVPGVGDSMLFVGTQDGHLLGFGFVTPTPALSGDDVNFSPTVVGQSVTAGARFTATSATQVTGMAVTGTGYSLGEAPSTINLTAGQTLDVPVTFSPQSIGDNPYGELTVTTSDSGAITVALDGQGVASRTVSASPVEVDFAGQPIGGGSVSQTVAFTNNTSGTVTVEGVEDPPSWSPFTVTGLATTGTIAPGGTVSFTVSFTPPGTSGDYDHVYSSLVTLQTNLGDFAVPLSGSADTPSVLTVSPSSLDFHAVTVGASETLYFDVGDNGGLPLHLTSATSTGSDGFAATTAWSTSTQVDANSEVQEAVTFTPTVAGPASATWTITSDASNGPLTLTLNGLGVATVPGVPGDVQASAGYQSATVSWSAPASDGGAALSDYQVTAQDLTDSARGAQSCATVTTSCTVPGLSDGDAYAFSVAAVNSQGTGASATSSPVVPFLPTLSITTASGASGGPLVLATTGDPLGAGTSYYAVNGTAQGCRVVAGQLVTRSAGTCWVVAVRAGDSSVPTIMSVPTRVTLAGRPASSTTFTVGLRFPPTSSTLTTSAIALLDATVAALARGTSLTLVSYDPTAALARSRGQEVAAFLRHLANVRITVVSRVGPASRVSITRH